MLHTHFSVQALRFVLQLISRTSSLLKFLGLYLMSHAQVSAEVLRSVAVVTNTSFPIEVNRSVL